jgi:hypothetical protein
VPDLIKAIMLEDGLLKASPPSGYQVSIFYWFCITGRPYKYYRFLSIAIVPVQEFLFPMPRQLLFPSLLRPFASDLPCCIHLPVFYMPLCSFLHSLFHFWGIGAGTPGRRQSPHRYAGPGQRMVNRAALL